MTRAITLSFVLALAIASTAKAEQPAPSLPWACRGVRDAEQHVAMFTDPRNILRVQRVMAPEPASEAETPDQRAGARITILARPGMTAEWLQRVAECHIALEVARHYEGATQSPLDVPGITVFVSSVGDGFAVDILSYDVKVAREILRRAVRIAPGPVS